MKKRLLTLIITAGALLVASCAPTVTSTSSSSLPPRSHITDTTSENGNESVSESTATSEQKTSSEQKSSTSTVTPPADSKWNVNFSQYGNDFRSTLESLITAKRTKKITYKECLATGAKAAAYPAGSSTFVPFYHDESKTTTQSACNREHTWPNSRGSGETGPGADPFIIRPTLSSENSSRGNYFYGNEKSNEWDPASCGFEGARGEAARVILYAATAYHTAKGFELSNNPGDATSLKTMGTLKTLLKWNAAYAPTTIEKQINEYLSSNGFGRNPFVDHPEYADYIWDESGVRKTSFDGTSGGGSTGGGDVEVVPQVKYDLINALSDIEGASRAIVSGPSTTELYGLTNIDKSADLPWYITGVSVTTENNMSKMSCDSTSLGWFKVEKASEGKYKIIDETRGSLYNYTESKNSKTYNSICWDAPSASTVTAKSDIWEITMDATGACTFKGETGVYLEYYNGSWCGYKSAPSVGIYLYK